MNPFTVHLLVLALICKFASSNYEKINQKCFEYNLKCIAQQPIPLALIIGGHEISEGQSPHMVLIGFGQDSSIEYQCGGSLISENYVLTAAHCTNSRDLGNASTVKVGMIDRNYKGPNLQERNVKEIRVHPHYKKPLKYNDIALLLLERPVEFTGTVRPACLSTLDNFAGIVPNAIGFGKTSYESESQSDRLLEVELSILEKEQCQSSFKNPTGRFLMPLGIVQSQICAGNLNGGHDTCLGDSGGPLQFYALPPNCVPSIIGVTSFGKFCGLKNSPAIYTRIYLYLDWIQQIVWP